MFILDSGAGLPNNDVPGPCGTALGHEHRSLEVAACGHWDHSENQAPSSPCPSSTDRTSSLLPADKGSYSWEPSEDAPPKPAETLRPEARDLTSM